MDQIIPKCPKCGKPMMPAHRKREYGKEAKRSYEYPSYKCDECGEVAFSVKPNSKKGTN